VAKRWINSADVEVSPAGALLTEQAPPTAISGGTKNVASAATPEALAASTPCRSVFIVPTVGNTGTVHLGSDSVQPMLIGAGGVRITIANLAQIYVKVSVNGEGVDFIYTV